ncbi:hypothetical protein AC578_4660 [Pseudocercospora eumusae]|uniref:Uncharacterized protein n=1 Tax=Pseudocercospora eumusae TaxID=321146 RepID=A0A139H7H2_9PEZI|nr:hypothetical protein AC578_4660 [Pseudocercospora eumusae]
MPEDPKPPDRHASAQCPISSCPYGKPPGKARLRHDVFVHLRKTHRIVDLPLRPQSKGFNLAEHNKACLEHFLNWADEHDVEHTAERFFKYAVEKRRRGVGRKESETGVVSSPSLEGRDRDGEGGATPVASSVAPSDALPASFVPGNSPGYGQGNASLLSGAGAGFPPLQPPHQPVNALPAPFVPRPLIPPLPVPAPTPWYAKRRAPLLYPVSTTEEEAEQTSDIPNDEDYSHVSEGNPKLNSIVSQLRAGLHQQLIDVIISALGDRAKDLRHDSAYRCLILALLITHAPRTQDLAEILVSETQGYRSWLKRQMDPDTPHNLYYSYCGTERAEDGFFDVMYGIFVDVSMRRRNHLRRIAGIDFVWIVVEFGGEEEGMHARDFDEQCREELLCRDEEVLYGSFWKAVRAWLGGYKDFRQAFFKHVVFELDAEDERRERMRRGLEGEKD